jgi:carboxypeptidase Taq
MCLLPPAIEQLKKHLLDLRDLESVEALLGWDQATYLPEGGVAARGRQQALIGRLSHEHQIDPALGRLLDQAEKETANLDDDSDDASLVRVARRDYDRATRVPSAHLAAFYLHSAEAYETWRKARPENNFELVRPYLEKTLDFSREYAGFFPGYEHIADPLIDLAERDMKASQVRAWFAPLRQALVPLVEQITRQPEPDLTPVHQTFPAADQLSFGLQLAQAMGFDPRRARQDKSPHPFMTRIADGDVRMTTRVKEHDLTEALFSTLHEAGHALYELGTDPALDGTPLAGGASSGVHESQSRLWENLVGRSRAFWVFAYPKLQAVFPSQLGGVSMEAFYRAVNRVARSLIRTDADEVTYNLHVMIRFDLELEMLEGQLEVRHLPEAWNARYQSDLGVTPPNDADGVLQDVHWYGGRIGGAFQSYTLGNIMSAQFIQAAEAALPDLQTDLQQGDFTKLHGWLVEHVYRHGRKFSPAEVVMRATGRPLELEPYLDYLRSKFSELYSL